MHISICTHAGYYRKRVLDERNDEDFVLHKIVAQIVAHHLRLQYGKTRPVIIQINACARNHAHTQPHTHTNTQTPKSTNKNPGTNAIHAYHRHTKTNTHANTDTTALHTHQSSTREFAYTHVCRSVGAWEPARPAHLHARSKQRRHAEDKDRIEARVTSSRGT